MDKLWLLVFAVVLVWSAINPADYFTWFLEVLPAIIGLLVLLATRKSFPLTPLVYALILIHCVILMVGGHYTYAEVPLFDWIRDSFGLARNNYDKVGHFAQGFIPAMVAREILIRKNGLWRLQAVSRPRHFSVRRGMYGILSQTWALHWSVL